MPGCVKHSNCDRPRVQIPVEPLDFVFASFFLFFNEMFIHLSFVTRMLCKTTLNHTIIVDYYKI